LYCTLRYIVILLYMAVSRTRLLNCYYCWCSFYCFYLIDFDWSSYLFLFTVSLLAIRLPWNNKLELSRVDTWYLSHIPISPALGDVPYYPRHLKVKSFTNSWPISVFEICESWRRTGRLSCCHVYDDKHSDSVVWFFVVIIFFHSTVSNIITEFSMFSSWNVISIGRLIEVTHAQETCTRNFYQKLARMHVTKMVRFDSLRPQV